MTALLPRCSVVVQLWLCLTLVLVAGMAVARGVNPDDNSISLALATEPPSLDHSRSTDQISSFVLSHVMEGLLQYGPTGKLLPGVAQSWEIDANGARFTLRNDARWSDGQAVTAADFVFAWRRAVDPATASQYSFIMYPIKNAERINRGELPVSALGVRATSATELVVEFERPCPWFDSLMAFMTFYPLREDAVQRWGRRYAADADTMLFNGPFTLSRWVHGAELSLTKNPQYWNRQAVGLDRIHIPYITSDANARFNLFHDGSIALTQLDANTLPRAVAKGHSVIPFLTGTLFFLEFNFRLGRVTRNLALRKAIQAVLDPALLVNRIVGLPGVRPGASLFPKTVRGVGGSFRDEYPVSEPERGLATARRWMIQARQEVGEIPPLLLLVGDSPLATREAEFYQYLLRRALGLEVIIDQQTFKQRIARMRRGEFDIAAGGWGPDYDDALTFGDLLASWNDNNRGRYVNPEYDALVREAMNNPNRAARMEAFAAMQQIVVQDVPLLPTYENVNLYSVNPSLSGVFRSIFGGDPNYRYARIVAP